MACWEQMWVTRFTPVDYNNLTTTFEKLTDESFSCNRGDFLIRVLGEDVVEVDSICVLKSVETIQGQKLHFESLRWLKRQFPPCVITTYTYTCLAIQDGWTWLRIELDLPLSGQGKMAYGCVSVTDLLHHRLCDRPQLCGLLVEALLHSLLHRLRCTCHRFQAVVIQQGLGRGHITESVT